MAKIQWYLILFILIISCEKHEINVYAGGFEPKSPYEDPIWHPSGEIIGFNHVPIKEIHYNNGYDHPDLATYIYEEDSAGFWIINADGTNQNRLLPYQLGTPAWSPDGNWITFSKGGQIFKMPFNENRFDTTIIIQLTFEGRNSFPTWSPDGEWIAYESDKNSSTGLSFIWKMKNNGLLKKRIAYTPDEGEVRMPFWGNNFNIVQQRYIGIASPEIFSMDSSGNNVIRITSNTDDEKFPKYSPDNKYICFISQSNSVGGIRLWRFGTFDKSFIQLTNSYALNFSWSPNGKIVYLNFNLSRIDKTQGTLWIMDADGKNQRQLTHNNIQIIQ